MSPLTSVLCAAAGAAAGAAGWVWLRTGSYRTEGDEPRRRLRSAWLVVPVAALGGGIAGLSGDWTITLPAWIYLVGAVSAVWIDLDVHRIPDRVLLVWAPLMTVSLVVCSAVANLGWHMLLRAGITAVGLGVIFLGLALAGSMGLGDVKLAAVTGLLLGWLGWPAVVLGTVSAFVLAAVVAVVFLARGASRTAHLAFGPAIIAGAAVAVFRVGLGM